MTQPRMITPADAPSRWRERGRLLLAILSITLAYLGIQEVWMWGAGQLAHQGWTVNDPATTYASEAAELAEQSRAREAMLPPGFARQVFQLGYEYGYLSQWLGGYGRQDEPTMRQLSRPVKPQLLHLDQLARQLGIAPIAPYSVRTAADFSELRQRIEADGEGHAARLEQAGSPRSRHLFLFAAHVGTEAAALEAARDLTPIPATALIGKHATLAGIPEPLWRPLSRISRGTSADISRDYGTAVARLDSALVGPLAP